MNNSSCSSASVSQNQRSKANQNIQVYVRVRPLNSRERCIRSTEVIDVLSPKEIVTRHSADSKLTKKFTFDRTFGIDSKQSDVYNIVVAPLIEEVLSGYNCTVFAYGQTGTGKTHTMVGTECAELKSSWEDDSEIGIIPRALSHLFDELRLMEMEFSMRISYLELYNEELCDLLSSDDSTKIRIFDDTTKKGSVIIQGLEEIPVHSKDDVYKLLEKGKERRKTATTLMNAQSSRSHTVFSILVHIRENGIDGEEMLKIGKLNLVDLAGSENVSKAGNEKGIRVRETVNINQSLLTLGRVITALVERTPHIPYRESKLTRLLQESLGGRTKTSIIATISPGHKDIEETLSTLEYAHRAKNIQNKPEVNQKLTKKTVLKEYTEEIDKLKRDLMAARDKNGIYLAEETYNKMTLQMDSQNRELNEKMLLLKALKDELQNKEKIFNEVSFNLIEKTEELTKTKRNLTVKEEELLQTKKVLNTTKRRYKENKFILQSHVKTEEVLMNQACKILEVADIATNDTHQLHNTIERRKDVDIKIQSACEKFSERMQLNFELMDENLENLQEHHKSHSNLILEEITNGTKAQNKLINCTQTEIESLNKICENYFNSISSLCDKYTTKFGNLSKEHKKELLHFFQELKNNDNSFQKEIQTNLSLLQTLSEEQKSTIDLMRENIVAMLEHNTNDLKTSTTLVQTELKQIKTNVETSLEKLSTVEEKIKSEQSLNIQEQQIVDDYILSIDEFVQKMKAVKDTRINHLETMQATVLETQQNERNIIADIQQSSNQMENFCQGQSVRNIAAVNQFQSIASAAESIVDKNIAKCSSLQIQIKDHNHETEKQINTFKLAEDKYCTNAHNLLADYETDIKRQRVENKTNIKNGCEAFQNGVNENSKRLKSHLTQTLAFASSLENHVRDYAQIYKEQISTCEEDLKTFKRSEMQTYSSTGSTPSKRVFTYPRILAATSPHQNIVKRFREENDWSDLDTTATINEEGTEDDNLLMHDISDTETILNSTPIEDVKKEKRDSIYQENRDTLKSPIQQVVKKRQSPKQGRSVSPLNQKLSPRKPSPQQCSPRKQAPTKSSPAYLESNKENMV